MLVVIRVQYAYVRTNARSAQLDFPSCEQPLIGARGAAERVGPMYYTILYIHTVYYISSSRGSASSLFRATREIHPINIRAAASWATLSSLCTNPLATPDNRRLCLALTPFPCRSLIFSLSGCQERPRDYNLSIDSRGAG